MAEKIFEVEVSNSSPRGYETATVLKMPATWAEFHDALQKARIKDARHCENELTCIRFHGVTNTMIGQNVDLYDLNLFAQRLDALNEDQKIGLEALLHMEQSRYTGSIPLDRLIDLTYNTDVCCLAPHIFNRQELGMFLYENEMLSDEAMSLLDTLEKGSRFRAKLLELLGEQHQEEHGGVFTRNGYTELGGDIQTIHEHRPGETLYFHRSGAPVVLEMRKRHFDDPAYDSDKTAVLNLPASDADIWRAVGEVAAASPKECAFRCTDCRIPSLREAINDAIEDGGGLEQANRFARQLAKNLRIWDLNDLIKYKALLAASGPPDLEQAAELAKDLDQYELRPEIAANWEYAAVVLREKYPDLPEELFQTPQAARIGQQMLEDIHVVITDYGLLRRKDGGQLPVFQGSAQKPQGLYEPQMGGM